MCKCVTISGTRSALFLSLPTSQYHFPEVFVKTPMAEINSRTRSRSWQFTVNNPTEEDWEDCIQMDCRYYCLGQEIGDNGTDHIQGFVMFAEARSFMTVKELLPRARLEAVTKTPDKAANYCKKDGLFTEFGTAPESKEKQGKRGGQAYVEAMELAIKGDFKKINAGIYIRCHRQLHAIYKENMPAPKSMPDMDFHWFYGATGTGKSRAAREENPDHYIKNLNKWWTHYAGEACVIIEEWHPGMVEALQHMLKQWCDHHPFRAETKGDSMVIRPKKIVITSNYTIEECFPDPRVGETIIRRFKKRQFGEAEPVYAMANMTTGYDSDHEVMEMEDLPSPDLHSSPQANSPSPNPFPDTLAWSTSSQ